MFYLYSDERREYVTISNGHARLSQRKVANLLKVDPMAVNRRVHSVDLYTPERAETIAEQGFEGVDLAVLVEYYAFDSNQASKETKQHCRNIYRQASSKGFQDFIDAIAGIEKQPEPSTLPPSSFERVTAVNGMVSALTFLKVDVENPRFLQALQDLALDTLGVGQPALPATTQEVWLGVAERAEQLGYPIALVTQHRSQLGKAIAKVGLMKKQEKRLCGGTQRPINLYLKCDELDAAIARFFQLKLA